MTQENPWIFCGTCAVIYEISVPINFQGPKKKHMAPGRSQCSRPPQTVPEGLGSSRGSEQLNGGSKTSFFFTHPS